MRAAICDITEREAVRSAVGGFGPLDVLVNNAGLELITPPMLLGGEEVERTFKRIIDINVVGTLLRHARSAARACRAGGSIVITASVWGKSR